MVLAAGLRGDPGPPCPPLVDALPQRPSGAARIAGATSTRPARPCALAFASQFMVLRLFHDERRAGMCGCMLAIAGTSACRAAARYAHWGGREGTLKCILLGRGRMQYRPNHPVDGECAKPATCGASVLTGLLILCTHLWVGDRFSRSARSAQRVADQHAQDARVLPRFGRAAAWRVRACPCRPLMYGRPGCAARVRRTGCRHGSLQRLPGVGAGGAAGAGRGEGELVVHDGARDAAVEAQRVLVQVGVPAERGPCFGVTAARHRRGCPCSGHGSAARPVWSLATLLSVLQQTNTVLLHSCTQAQTGAAAAGARHGVHRAASHV